MRSIQPIQYCTPAGCHTHPETGAFEMGWPIATLRPQIRITHVFFRQDIHQAEKKVIQDGRDAGLMNVGKRDIR